MYFFKKGGKNRTDAMRSFGHTGAVHAVPMEAELEDSGRIRTKITSFGGK